MNWFYVWLVAIVGISMGIAKGDEVTYRKIKPILVERCGNCHGPSWKEKNWLNYKTAKENSDKIKLRVCEQKTMPPANITGLEDEEREQICKWIDGGCKQ